MADWILMMATFVAAGPGNAWRGEGTAAWVGAGCAWAHARAAAQQSSAGIAAEFFFKVKLLNVKSYHSETHREFARTSCRR
jgi:hypothetical protein